MKSAFSLNWKRSTQPRKQRKYRYNAPLHILQKFVNVHLSKDLRTKYGLRSVQVKKGDKVKVLRGSFSKKEAKVDLVNLKKTRVYLAGIEIAKKAGEKVPVPFTPSNLMITELTLSDKKRKNAVERKNLTSKKGEQKPTQRVETKENNNEESS